MHLFSATQGTVLLIVFGLAMVALVWFRTHAENHADGFLVADRKVSLWQGAFSIAVSWIWAPAIFICSQQAYQLGLPGIFWFTLPNIVCFFIFAPIAKRIRAALPEGYTLPEYISFRFQGDTRAHLVYLLVTAGYQLGAIIINALAGGALLHLVSGIDVRVAIIGMSVIALAYSLLSGLKASIYTDVIQMLMVLVIALVIVPLCLVETGGPGIMWSGLGGVEGRTSLFDPWVAFSFGIPASIGLIAGPLADQMFFQRTMAVKRESIVKTFVYGGLLFGIIPIVLSMLGFIGAGLELSGALEVTDPQLIGPVVIAHILPKGAMLLFCFMAFAGLCSTMDSGLCAGSSIGAIDVFRRYFRRNASDRELLLVSRLTMILMTVVGTSIALLQPKLLWLFLIYGALGAAGLFPTILSVLWKKTTAAGVFWGVLLSIGVGLPFSIYANVMEDPYLVVAATVLSAAIGLVVCVTLSLIGAERPAAASCKGEMLTAGA